MDSSKAREEIVEEERSMPLYTMGIASQLSEIPAHSIRQYIDEAQRVGTLGSTSSGSSQGDRTSKTSQ